VSTDRFTEQYRQLVSDPEIRAALLADPKAALVSYFGEIVAGDYRIEVIEQRSDTITALIPAPPEPGTDSSTRLAQVSGRVFDLLHSTGVGGYVIPDARLMWVLRDMRALWTAGGPAAPPTADETITEGGHS
jgi:hypothetical protein